MADHHSHHLLPPLDVRDPDFQRNCRVWAHQAVGDMMETVAATKQTIATSRVLMAEVDRLLARG